jgi:hypothetical protein
MGHSLMDGQIVPSLNLNLSVQIVYHKIGVGFNLVLALCGE